MLVLVPESLHLFSNKLEKTHLKIISLIVGKQIKKCSYWMSKNGLGGAPAAPSTVFRQWANVFSKELKSIASNYRDICIYLEKENIIERNNKAKYSNFTNNKYPYSFRLGQSLWNDTFTLKYIDQRKTIKINCSGIPYKNEYLVAENHLNKFYLPPEYLDQYNSICELSAWPLYSKASISQLYSTKWWSKIDKYGRYHTPLTNLVGGVRGFLKYKNENIIGFDFANFQPSLLCLYDKELLIQDDSKLYFELCRKGMIYDYMAKNSPINSCREDVKKEFLIMLNVTNNRMIEMPIFKTFQQYFPTFAKLIEQIKRDNHKNMANYLQRKESEIIFGCIVSNFISKTKSPFFTVHDAIYTTESKSKMLKNEFIRAINMWKIPTRVKEDNINNIYQPIPSM